MLFAHNLIVYKVGNSLFKHIDSTSKSSKIKSLWKALFGRLPVKKNTVLFNSFYGMYNDNPRYVSIKLHEKYPDIKIIWVISAKNHENVPDYVKTVKYESAKYYYWTYRANAIVDNMLGIRPHGSSSKWYKNFLKSVLRIFAPLRKKKQYNISTWHGTPLKRLGLDRFDKPQPKFKRVQGSCDCMLAGCTLTRDCIKSAHFREFMVPFNMYGTPRNDILFDKDADILALKQKLNLPEDKKIILFAPTFRDDSIDDSGITQMNSIDFYGLFDTLHKKFGDEWCFVFRVHHVVVAKIDVDALVNKYGARFINGNIGDDMAEYLKCADILLTDYSSSMFDYALTKKPCFLYTPDKEHYEKDLRGFYFSMDTLPFPVSNDYNGLIENIQNFDDLDYMAKVDNFLTEIGNVEDGHASERVVDDIKYFLDTGIKR